MFILAALLGALTSATARLFRRHASGQRQCRKRQSKPVAGSPCDLVMLKQAIQAEGIVPDDAIQLLGEAESANDCGMQRNP